MILILMIDPHDGEPMYWSNDDGWVDWASATRFTEHEATSLELPLGGVWVLECGDPATASGKPV